MTETKTTILEPAFAADVAEVQRALVAWRKRRKPREPMPESLWNDVVRLAQVYKLSPVAHVLRLNYTSLKFRYSQRGSDAYSVTVPPVSPT